MTELAGYILETLREGREFTLYRGRRADNIAPVLVVAIVSQEHEALSLRRLEHEYSLANALDSAWAVRPLALARYDGRLMLVLEDPGGTPLDGMLARPLELTRFLQIAVALAAAVRQLHGCGLMHKDIKPANVLLDASGTARLMGFGMASRLPQERQAPDPPEVIAGTFAYMAPEQTGRMNRSMDARSDLYSLGVTLYEMLTGALPFTAADPMEWIHCHMARKPMPPSERVIGLPGPVEAIVLKLLGKNAEDRYQTAGGVEADLRRCLSAWTEHGRIDAFALAERDASDRLLVPERLYGREAAARTLVAAFDRVVTQGASERILVSGDAGIGKSSLVNELHRVLVPSRGLFAAGKFDQYKRDIPYATLAQAFEHLIRHLLSKDDAELGRWRAALLDALGPNGQLMVNLIPVLALIVGEQSPVAELPPQDRQSRFLLVFRRLLGVFARPEHPLVIFLDDMQWVDTATIGFLERIVQEPEIGHVLVIFAYRDNEVGPAHPLVRMLATVADARGKIEEIRLNCLDCDDVARLVADALHAKSDRVLPLAELIFEKTGGNPFFTLQFLSTLAAERLIAFDRETSAWRWDLDRIRAKGITDNVADLMAGKLNRLSELALATSKQLACMGSSAHTATLAMVLGVQEDEIHAAMAEVVQAALVFRLDGAYAFVHDRIQEAVYALIPDTERAGVHLRIGRELAKQTAPEKLEETIFDIVIHLNRGAALISSQDERAHVAELNLIAGRRAKTSTAYASALTYLTSGSELLAETSWQQTHGIAFAIELNRAECEFLTGQLVVAKGRLSELWERSRNIVDRAAITRLRLTLYTTLDQFDRAVEIGLAYLRHVGIDWSPHPTDEQVRQELEAMQRRLDGRAIAQLLDLPSMSNLDWRATMDVFTDMVSPARYTDTNLFNLISIRMVNLSLEHGNCDASCYAYTSINTGDNATTLSFGQLGFDLVQKRGLDRFKARVYSNFGMAVAPWTKDLSTSRAIIRLGFDAATASGDLTFATYGFKSLITNRMVAGEPLADVQREAEQGLAFARKARFGLLVDRFIAQLLLILALRGLASDAVSVDGAEFKEDLFERRLEENPNLIIARCFYWIYQLQERYFQKKYAAGIEAAAKASTLLTYAWAYLETADYHFYGALTRAAVCNSAPADQRQQHLEALFAHYEQIAVWAKSCPENFANRAELVAAEIARIEGRQLEAEGLYEQAIQSARDQGFVQNEGLGNELAAQFFASRGFKTIADAYLRNARSCFLRWGADGKVAQLDQDHPHLRQRQLAPVFDITAGTPVEHLDLTTVIEVMQAVSKEIDLSKLIDNLMVTALEHAGADRGLLIVSRGAELQVEAEATITSDAVQVHLRKVPVVTTELPESILRYVVRTQDSLLMDDASEPNSFSEDAYIRQSRCRSLLCLPLTKQSTLIGVLYLENGQVSHVFTPARIAVLRLLASQAAISLENARLYSDLKNTEAERRLVDENLQASLKEKEALLKEVHHRVKNNLQLISSLLNLQAARVTDPAVAELFVESRNRVRSMALVHENLYRAGNFARIRMGPHIQNLCAHLMRAYGQQGQHVKLETEIEDVELELDRAISAGMIVNELVSNALKHAFSDGRAAGFVRVELKLLDGNRYALAVIDDGLGLPRHFGADRTDTMGLQLVHDLTRQLQGTIEVKCDRGTNFIIYFDADDPAATSP